MKKVLHLLTLLSIVTAGSLISMASSQDEASQPKKVSYDPWNVAITIDDPDAVSITVGWDGDRLTLDPGRNEVYVEPYDNVMFTVQDNYEIVSIEGEVFGFDGIYSFMPDYDETYEIVITTKKLAQPKFYLDVDDASRVYGRYVGKDLNLVNGLNEMDLRDMSTITLYAADGYRICEADGFEYDPIDEIWSRYITSSDEGATFIIRTEEYTPDFKTAYLDALSDPSMFDVYVDNQMVNITNGINFLKFKDYHNHCDVVLHSQVCQAADVIVNGERINVISNTVSFDLGDEDGISVELFESLEERNITVMVDEPDRLFAKNTNTGAVLELQHGANILDCSGDYMQYEFKAIDENRIVSAEGGFSTNEYEAGVYRIYLNGNEAGNVYSITTEEIVRNYLHATIRTSNPEKFAVLRIGSQNFDISSGEADLFWEEGAMHQLYARLDITATEMPVVTVNGDTITGDDRVDYFRVMLNENDLVEVNFKKYDLRYDVTLQADGPREGFEVYTDGTLLEGESFNLPVEAPLTIVPMFGYNVTSVKVDGISFDPDDDGSYFIPAVTANHVVKVKVHKEYYVNAQDLFIDGSKAVEVFIIDELEGDLIKNTVAKEGDSIYLYKTVGSDFEFLSYVVCGADVVGNSFTVDDSYTGEDGHTITVTAAGKGIQTGVDAMAEINSDARIFTINGVEVTGQSSLQPGIYIVVNKNTTKKITII